MNEDEMIRKMGLDTWNETTTVDNQDQSTWVGNTIFEYRGLIDVDVRRGHDDDFEQVGLLLTPDEAEAFGLRLVAAAGIVRARQATKEPNNECG